MNGIELWINLWYHTFKLKLQTQKQLTKNIKKSLEEIKYSSLDNTVQTKSSSNQVLTILIYSFAISSNDYTAQTQCSNTRVWTKLY